MDAIYLVVGETGDSEFDTFFDWNVKAFLSEENAKEFAKKLNQWCEENISYENEWKVPDTCPFDPEFYCSRPGVDYQIETLPLGD